MLKFFTYPEETNYIFKYFDAGYPSGLRVETDYNGKIKEKILYFHGESWANNSAYLIWSSLNPSSINMKKYFDKHSYSFNTPNNEFEIDGPGVLNGITLIMEEKYNSGDFITFSNFPGKIRIIEELKSIEEYCGETPRIGFDLNKFFDTSLRFSKVKDEGADICYNSNYLLNTNDFNYLFDMDESEMTEEDKEILDYIQNKLYIYKENGEFGASNPREGIYYFVYNDYWDREDTYRYGFTFTPENLLNIEFTSMIPMSISESEAYKNPVLISSQYAEYNVDVYKPVSYSYINTYEYNLPNGGSTSIDLFTDTIKFTCLNKEGKPFYILLLDRYPYDVS